MNPTEPLPSGSSQPALGLTHQCKQLAYKKLIFKKSFFFSFFFFSQVFGKHLCPHSSLVTVEFPELVTCWERETRATLIYNV